MAAKGEREEAGGEQPAGDVVPIAPDLTTRMGSILEAVQHEADRILERARAEAHERAGAQPAPAASTAKPAPLPGIGPETHRAAVQMALLGCTRAQVDSHLRGYLGVAEPTALLDRIYGLGSDAEARVPWAQPPG